MQPQSFLPRRNALVNDQLFPMYINSSQSKFESNEKSSIENASQSFSSSKSSSSDYDSEDSEDGPTYFGSIVSCVALNGHFKCNNDFIWFGFNDSNHSFQFAIWKKANKSDLNKSSPYSLSPKYGEEKISIFPLKGVDLIPFIGFQSKYRFQSSPVPLPLSNNEQYSHLSEINPWYIYATIHLQWDEDQLSQLSRIYPQKILDIVYVCSRQTKPSAYHLFWNSMCFDYFCDNIFSSKESEE